jgi:hypothetical protein
MLLVVDTEALHSTHNLSVDLPKHYFGKYPFLKVWDRDAPEEEEDYSMRALRSRTTDWFSRDLVVYEDDAYVRQYQDGDNEEDEEEDGDEGSG